MTQASYVPFKQDVQLYSHTFNSRGCLGREITNTYVRTVHTYLISWQVSQGHSGVEW